MNEFQIKQIDRYLRNEMSTDESLEFERTMDTDPELVEAVELEKLALKAIQLAAHHQLKSRLLALEHPVDSNTPNKNVGHPKAHWLLLATGLFLGTLFFVLKNENCKERGKVTNTESPLYNQDMEAEVVVPVEHFAPSITLPPVDTAREAQKENKRKENSSKPIAYKSKKTAQKALFAQYFSSDRPNTLEFATRSTQSDQSPRSLFERAYNRMNADSMLLMWAQIPKEEKEDPTLLYPYAIALIQKGFVVEAKTYLIKVQKNPQFQDYADWNLALIEVYQGNIKLAKQSFENLNKTSIFQKQNGSIIDALNSF